LQRTLGPVLRVCGAALNAPIAGEIVSNSYK
jgi:hypothetical protein